MPTNQMLELIVGQLWQVTILCVVVQWLTKTLLKNQPLLSYQLWVLVMLKSVTPPIWASHCGVFTWLFQGLTTVSTSALQLLVGNAVTPRHVALALVCLWASGIFLSLGSVCVRWFRIHRRITASAVETPSCLNQHILTLAKRLGIRRKVRLVVTAEPIGPAVIGYWSPLVILPAEIVAERSVHEMEPILAHELLHVKRGDTLVALLETLVRFVWWFHPTVHRAADALSQSGELCCDQDVLEQLAYEPRRYAESLIQVIEARCNLQPLAGQPGIRQEQITRDRLRRIMTGQASRPRRVLRISLLLLGALIILPGRAFG